MISAFLDGYTKQKHPVTGLLHPAYRIGMTVEAAEHALQAFSYTYPELAKWQRYKRQQAKYTNKVISRSGLVRDFAAQPAGNKDAEAMNAPIQATGAEILLASMRRLDRPLASTVHDELTILAPIGEADKAAKELKEAMLAGFSEILPEYDQLLYGLVEVSIGKTWADVH